MWVLALIKSDWFANGLQIYDKTKNVYGSGKSVYRFGDHPLFINPLYEIPLDELDLEWVDLKQERKPTFLDKIKEKVFRIPFEREITVRPTSGSIVAVNYGDGKLIEIVEFKTCDNGKSGRWVTELYTGVMPKQWAYLPNEIIELSKNKKNIEGYDTNN